MALDLFLGNQSAATPERNIGDVPAYIRSLPANTFRKAHGLIFRDFFPKAPNVPNGGGGSELLDKVKARVARAIRPDDRQELQDLLQAKTASGIYRTLVFTLLQTFLECEISRPRPLRFDTSFGQVEPWNKARHGKQTIDPRDDRVENLSPRDMVRVVLPPVYLAQNEHSNLPVEVTEFSTLGDVLVEPNKAVKEEQEGCEDEAAIGGTGRREFHPSSAADAEDGRHSRQEISKAGYDTAPPSKDAEVIERKDAGF